MKRFLLSVFIFVASFFGGTYVINSMDQNVGVSIPQGVAVFETSLQTPITSSATTMTLTANSVRGGSTLSGYQCFTIDEGSAQAEFVCGTISGTTVSSLTRGVDPVTATSTNSALQFAHRRGANVKITDFPLIQVMRNVINGNEAFPNLLAYDAVKCSAGSASTSLCDKSYIDGVAIAGASDATESIKGIVEIAADTEYASTGGTGATLVIPASSASTSATANKLVRGNGSGKIAQLWLDLTEAFTWAGNHIFSGNVTVTGETTLATTTINGSALNPSFGGTGADGALTITSGTTTIDLGGADYFIKNYSSISITGTGSLAFTNKGPNGTVIVLKSTGDVTLTSSVTAIDISYLGASTSYDGVGNVGGGKLGKTAVSGSGGAGGEGVYSLKIPLGKMVPIYVGGGGGGGFAAGTPGVGGHGGGALYIEVGGSFNRTSTILAKGQNGTNGAAQGSSASGGGGGGGSQTIGGSGSYSAAQTTGGGGGGGGGGVVVVLYNSLVANTGTTTVTGGTGGSYSGGTGGTGYYYFGQNNDL